MVVVADAILETGRRTCRLNAPDDPLCDEHGERVIDRLLRDGTNLGPDRFGHTVSRDVGLRRHGAQDREPLRSYLDAMLTEKIRRIVGHGTA